MCLYKEQDKGKALQLLQLLKETNNCIYLLLDPVRCWEHTYILLVSCVAYTNAQAIKQL